MIMTVTCPCGCGHTFEVEVKHETKKFSEEELARRAERMKAMRSAGLGGRPKGIKESRPRKTRSDKGKPRMSKKALEFLEKNGIDYVDEK